MSYTTNKKGQNAWNQIVRNKTNKPWNRTIDGDIDFMKEIKDAATTYTSFLRAAEAYLIGDIMSTEKEFKKVYPNTKVPGFRFAYQMMMRMVARKRRSLAFVQMQLSTL